MEFDAMLGGTIVNSLSSEANLAKAISLRYAAGGPVGISLTYFDEGELDTGGSRIGRPDGADASGVTALISVTAAYAITPSRTGRQLWNRVGTTVAPVPVEVRRRFISAHSCRLLCQKRIAAIGTDNFRSLSLRSRLTALAKI
jgi:hypothetical protein